MDPEIYVCNWYTSKGCSLEKCARCARHRENAYPFRGLQLEAEGGLLFNLDEDFVGDEKKSNRLYVFMHAFQEVRGLDYNSENYLL